jgi:hypothetical protein
MGPHMKTLLSALLLVASFAVSAQTPTPLWNLISIPDKTGNTVGYIYQTYAAGTVYESTPVKYVTALRLICSVKGKDEPIIALYWDGQDGTRLTDLGIDVKVDKKLIPAIQDYKWTQEGSLTYRKLSESTELITAMQNGHTISFSWFGADANRRYTILPLVAFNVYLNDFYASCKK